MLLHASSCAADGVENNSEGQPSQLSVVESSSGRQLASYRPMQRVWVRLSADGSRVHGPTLRMRLLADGHPEAQAAARGEAAEAAAAGASSKPQAAAAEVAEAGCATLPRPGAARPAYRPPGIGAAAGTGRVQGRLAVRGPPPGFEAGAATGAAEASAAAAAAGPVDGLAAVAPTALPHPVGMQPAPALSLAGQLQALLDAAGATDAEGCVLGWQADVAPLPLEAPPSSSGGGDSSGGAATGSNSERQVQAVARQALRRLQARAARLELRAAAGKPGRPRAEACGAAAAELREQIEALQHAVPG